MCNNNCNGWNGVSTFNISSGCACGCNHNGTILIAAERNGTNSGTWSTHNCGCNGTTWTTGRCGCSGNGWTSRRCGNCNCGCE